MLGVFVDNTHSIAYSVHSVSVYIYKHKRIVSVIGNLLMSRVSFGNLITDAV